MLSQLQREKCRRIAAALDAGQDPSTDGLSPEERGMVWSERAHVKAQDERRRARENAQVAVYRGRHLSADRPAEPRLDDLDSWPDEIVAQDDDEEDDGMVPCPVCDGRGKDAAGNPCESCGGTGRVENDQEENDEEE